MYTTSYSRARVTTFLRNTSCVPRYVPRGHFLPVVEPYGMPAAETYRVPVPRTRNEPKSATVARARVPPYFRRRYGGRRVPPRRGGSTHTKYRRYTNSTRRAYLRRRSAQSPRKTGSRSRNCTLHSTISYPHSTISYLHQYNFVPALHVAVPYSSSATASKYAVMCA